MSAGQLLKRVAASLSFATHTPIPYWLDLPLHELFDWHNTIAEMKGEGEGGS